MSPWPGTASGSSACARSSPSSAIRSGAYPAVHVVGTNGKSTATVTIEQLLLAEGLSVGAYDLAARRELGASASASTARRRTSRLAIARVRDGGRAPRRDAVRDRHRRGARRVRRRGGRRRSRRSGARRAPRRDERAAYARRPAHERRARAHGRPRRHGRGDRDGRSSRSRRRAPSSCCRTRRSHPSSRAATSRIGGAREAAEAFVGHAIET